MRTKSNIFLWLLYDFANSMVSIVFFLYFAQWIVIDQGVKDIYFNLAFTTSALLLLLTVPFTGVLLDKSWRRITGLKITTIFTAIFYGLCAFSAISDYSIPALIFFTLGLFSYLLSFTFYTPLLNDLAPSEKRGRLSGWGIAANYLGQFTGLLIVLPLSNGTISIFGASPRAETFLPAVIVFFIFSLPMLIFFKEPHKPKQKLSEGKIIKNTFVETKKLFLTSSISFFLLSFFFFNDAILTAVNNFPIFLEQVWQISDNIKTYLLLGIIVTSGIGAGLSGFVADKFGSKKTLMVILIGWLILLPLVGWLTNFTVFVISSVLIGLWYGASWAVSRSLMGNVSPEGKHNLSFAYFGLAERASSLIGPIVWGLVVTNLIELGNVRYRIAMLAVTVFVLFGIITLARVKER